MQRSRYAWSLKETSLASAGDRQGSPGPNAALHPLLLCFMASAAVGTALLTLLPAPLLRPLPPPVVPGPDSDAADWAASAGGGSQRVGSAEGHCDGEGEGEGELALRLSQSDTGAAGGSGRSAEGADDAAEPPPSARSRRGRGPAALVSLLVPLVPIFMYSVRTLPFSPALLCHPLPPAAGSASPSPGRNVPVQPQHDATALFPARRSRNPPQPALPPP